MGPNPVSGWACTAAVEIERQLDYIPGDDRDDGAQSQSCGLGTGRRANGDRFRLRVPTSGPLSLVHAGERPFAYHRPASGSALGRGSRALRITYPPGR